MCLFMRFHASLAESSRKVAAMERMQSGQKRGMSAAEVALGQIVFGDEIAWDRVRIVQAPRLGFGAMAPLGGFIIFSNWRAAADFSVAPMGEQSWLVHELAHVWQSAHGMFLPVLKLGALGKRAYAYAPSKSAALRDYNIERQAEIVRHLWLARMGVCEQGMPDPLWLEDAWASRLKAQSPAA